jgi:hypothetical protein
MRFLKTASIFFIVSASAIFSASFSSCSKAESSEEKQLIVEEYAKERGFKVEVCSRCGHTAVEIDNGDILLIHWNSPYVDYQNKKGRIKLKNKSRYENGQTYADSSLFKE